MTLPPTGGETPYCRERAGHLTSFYLAGLILVVAIILVLLNLGGRRPVERIKPEAGEGRKPPNPIPYEYE